MDSVSDEAVAMCTGLAHYICSMQNTSSQIAVTDRFMIYFISCVGTAEVKVPYRFGRRTLRSGENIYDRGNIDLHGVYDYSVPAHIGI